MENRKNQTAYLIWMCKIAMFAALMVALQLSGVGFIMTPWGSKITFNCMIVVVGTLAIDLKAGLMLAAIFGGFSTYTGIMNADLYIVGPLLSWSPLAVAFLSIVPRMMIPVVTWLVKGAMTKTKLKPVLQTGATAVAGSLTNTVLYLGTAFCLHLIRAENLQVLLTAIGLTGLLNGGLEAVLTALVAPPVVTALNGTGKKKK